MHKIHPDLLWPRHTLDIFAGVRNTLIKTVGSTRTPMPAGADHVRRMHEAGHALYCWSRGGKEYARDVAEWLEIADCFVDFLPKPDVCLDDQGVKLFDYCQVILPANASNH